MMMVWRCDDCPRSSPRHCICTMPISVVCSYSPVQVQVVHLSIEEKRGVISHLHSPFPSFPSSRCRHSRCLHSSTSRTGPVVIVNNRGGVTPFVGALKTPERRPQHPVTMTATRCVQVRIPTDAGSAHFLARLVFELKKSGKGRIWRLGRPRLDDGLMRTKGPDCRSLANVQRPAKFGISAKACLGPGSTFRLASPCIWCPQPHGEFSR
ncbi:hypothetical protein GGI42DRAFT_320271 [Trichoderma sp. SZMC 28013]